jgi:hypothetical protein
MQLGSSPRELPPATRSETDIAARRDISQRRMRTDVTATMPPRIGGHQAAVCGALPARS